MVYKVQVMSDEEAERYNKWQNDLDNVCDHKNMRLLVYLYFNIRISNSYYCSYGG